MSDPDSRPDPLQMSLAEKLACEWEARHDVAARGRIASQAPVQQYLTHVRCEDSLHAVPRQERAAAPDRAAGERTRAVPPGLRGWLRWGEDGDETTGSGVPRGC
jgi:hypothetical protein